MSPFTETIKQQYQKRKEIFEIDSILPDFKELILLRSVQSIAGNKPEEYKDWFEALYAMRTQMETIDYDVALLGCGAYGFPLAAWAKQNGKKAVLMGGNLQILFGIKGRRWENKDKTFERVMSRPAWVYPSQEETPSHIERVPGSGYW